MGSSCPPSLPGSTQLARPGGPAGPSQDRATQGEGSAARGGHCMGTSRSSAPRGRGGGRGEGPRQLVTLSCWEGGLEAALRDSGLNTLKDAGGLRGAACAQELGQSQASARPDPFPHAASSTFPWPKLVLTWVPKAQQLPKLTQHFGQRAQALGLHGGEVLNSSGSCGGGTSVPTPRARHPPACVGLTLSLAAVRLCTADRFPLVSSPNKIPQLPPAVTFAGSFFLKIITKSTP